MESAIIGLPGIGNTVTTTPREILAGNIQFAQFIPGGRVIDGTATRDPLNTDDQGNTYLNVIRAGLLMGKNTTTSKYANSIIGVTPGALGGNQTTLTVSAATAAEIVRRQGSSGTFNLTGPNVAAGVVRTQTVTYSAVNTTTGAVTITATGSAVVNAVNAVQTATFTDATNGTGTFTMTVEGVTTPAITYSITNATLITNINAGLNSAFGTSAIVASDGGSDVAAVNQIEAIPVVDSTGVGTFFFTIEGISTPAITYSATAATLVTNINAALNTAFGTSAIVASGASLAALILTFSGTNYKGRPIVGHAVSTITQAGSTFTINGSATSGTSTTTTAGVKAVNNIAITFSGTGYSGRPVGALTITPVTMSGVSTSVAQTTAGVTAIAAQGGEFIAGSFVQPTDGTQTILTVLAERYGWKVTDISGNGVDTFCPRLLSAGYLKTSNIINYPTDASLVTWVKNALNLNGEFTFDDKL